MHRSDGSGTTYIFTDFLSTVSSEWKSKVGGTGRERNVGGVPAPSVARATKALPDRSPTARAPLGTFELAYALENHMNTAPEFRKPGRQMDELLGLLRSAAFAASKPTDSAAPPTSSSVDSAGAGSYPIADFTHPVMVYKSYPDRKRMPNNSTTMLEWLVGGDAQRHCRYRRNTFLFPRTFRGTTKHALSEMSI